MTDEQIAEAIREAVLCDFAHVHANTLRTGLQAATANTALAQAVAALAVRAEGVR